MDHYPAVHRRPPRASVPDHGSRQHISHVQGHGYAWEELHQVKGVPRSAVDGRRPGRLSEQTKTKINQTQTCVIDFEEKEQTWGGCQEKITGTIVLIVV